jgi:hypothetical protein
VSLLQFAREIHSSLPLCSLNFEWTQIYPQTKHTQKKLSIVAVNITKKAIYITTVHTVVICNCLLIHCFCASPCSAEDNTDMPPLTESSEMLTNTLTKRNLLQYKQLFIAPNWHKQRIKCLANFKKVKPIFLEEFSMLKMNWNCQSSSTDNIYNSSGLQPGIHVPLGVYKDILGGMQKHLMVYVKLKKNLMINTFINFYLI